MAHIIPKFLGYVQEGKVKILDTHDYLAHLQKLENKDVYITVQKVRNIRSQQQMRYYFGVIVKLLSEHTGYEPEEMHEILKSEFAPLKEVKLGHEVKMIHGCTHDLFKDNFFSDYIERIQRWAAQDLKVVIPDPPRVDIQ